MSDMANLLQLKQRAEALDTNVIERDDLTSYEVAQAYDELAQLVKDLLECLCATKVSEAETK